MALKFLNDGYFAGKVGIGTESPTAKLHVSTGSSGATVYSGYNDMVIEGGNGASLSFLTPDANPVDINFGTPSSQFAAGIRAGYNSGTEFIAFKVVDSEKMRIIDTGNVGIGTINPGAKLEVAGTGDLSFKINNTQYNRSLIIEQGGGYSHLKASHVSGIAINYGQGNPGILSLFNNTTQAVKINTNGTSYLNGGNVGIGTTSPGEKLDLAGTNVGVKINGTQSSRVYYNRSGTYTWSTGLRSGDTKFHIFDERTGDRVIIDDAGNVGIGTTTPTARLDVRLSAATGRVAELHNNTGYGIGFTVEGDGGVNTINSESNQALAFATNGASNERMRITTGGNVGIGTTSPDYQLEVENTSAQATVGITGGNTDARLHLKNNEGTWLIQNDYSNTGALSFYNSTHRVVITEGGNVGIGTTSPVSSLNITTTKTVALDTAAKFLTLGLTVDDLTAGNTAGGGGGIAFRSKNTNAGTQIVFGAIDAIKESANVSDFRGSLRFFTNQNSTGIPLERMRIDSSGNVGIGTDSPSGILHVKGSTDDTVVYIDTNNNALGDSAKISFNDRAQVGWIDAAVTLTDGGGNKDIKLKVATGSVFVQTNNTTRLTVADGGNVGIGTTSPTAKLHVAGTGLFTGLVSGITPVAAANFVTKAYVDGSGGGTGPFLPLAGGTMTGVAGVVFPDAFKLNLGTGSDLEIYHNGLSGNNNIDNINGDLYMSQYANDKDIIFRSDNGGGGIAEYFRLDGSFEKTVFSKDIFLNDSVKALFGNSSDLQIYHNGSNNISFITNSNAAGLRLQSDELIIFAANGTTARADFDIAVKLFYNDSKKFETTNTGVTVTGAATATTFLGDLNGTINTATTAVTKANATNDTTVATTAFVQNLIGTIPAGLVFQGTWNAATNTPTLTSGSGTTGHFYIVSTDGSTNLDGITDWKVGDWAVFVEQGASDQWEKVDNSSVLDGSGTGGSVAGWAGSGTSNTLTNSPITFSGNNVSFAGNGTFAGSVIAPNVFTQNIYITSSGTNSTNRIDNDGTQLYLTYGGTSSRALEILNSNGNATFAGDVAIQKTGDVYLTLESTDATTTEEVAVKYSNQSTGSNYWWSGLNQSANYSLAYGTSYSGANVKMEISTAGNATFAGTITSGTLSVGTSGTSRFTDTSAFPLQLNRGLAVDTVGTAGVVLGLGAYSTGTTYVDAVRLVGILDANGTDGDMQLQVLNSGSYTAALTLNNDNNATFAGDINIGTGKSIYFSSTTGLRLVHDGSNGNVINSTGDLKITNGATDRDIIFRIKDGVNALEAMRVDGSSNQVGIGTTFPNSKLQVAGGIQMADDTDTAVVGKVGTMRYRTGTEYVEVTGINIITNGDFTVDLTDWINSSSYPWTSATWTASGVRLQTSSSAQYKSFFQNIGTITSGKIYRITFNAIRTSGTMRIGIESSPVGSSLGYQKAITSSQLVSEIFTATTTDTTSVISFWGQNDSTTSDWVISDVSLVEVTAEDASYADMCMQTGSSTYEWVNIVRNTY